MNVLVAIPYKDTLHPTLVARMEELVAALVCDGALTIAKFPNKPTKAAFPFEPHATARNALLDVYLKPEHDLVLWVDADLVDYPPDLIARLHAAAPGQIIAPQVQIEQTPLFYDINGFVDIHGKKARQRAPFFDDPGPLVRMQSVGCCYLIPAAIYHAGVRYGHIEGQVEHYSVCGIARGMGFKVFCDMNTLIKHALLPKYGEQWH